MFPFSLFCHLLGRVFIELRKINKLLGKDINLKFYTILNLSLIKYGYEFSKIKFDYLFFFLFHFLFAFPPGFFLLG